MIEHPEQHIILVSGATGRQGGAVVRKLLHKGWGVRALTRDPCQPAARALAAIGAEVVQSDMHDRSSLDTVVRGAYGVFSVQTSWEGSADIEVRQGENIADAARNAGVRHFVYSSAGGADRASDIRPQKQKWRVEQYLQELEFPATVLRPASFMDNYLMEAMRLGIVQGQLAEPLGPDTLLQRIAISDIAAFAALAFEQPEEFVDRSIEIAGDERTMTETANAFGKALGRPVEYVQLPWERFREMAGDDVTAMFQWLEAEGFQADVEECQRLCPGLRNLEKWIEDDFLNATSGEIGR